MKKENNKILTFMRRNAIYLILAACIVAVGLSITFMMFRQSNEITNTGNEKPPVVEQPLPEQPEPDDGQDTVVPEPDDGQPVQKPVVFVMPVENASSIAEYSDSLVWCSTLGRFQAHKAVDFYAPEGSDVLAVYDVYDNKLEFKLLPFYVKTKPDAVKVEYTYLPPEYTLDETIAYDEKLIPMRVIAYGVTAEYSLISGRFDEASIWDRRYKNSVLNLTLPKNTFIKGRYWR